MKARILPPTPENIAQAAEHLRAGGIVAMPTETVYGLAGSCFNQNALTRIFSTKERPQFDPLIVHIAESPLNLLVDESALSTPAKDRAELLTRRFWPGPLTLVLPKHSAVPDLVTSGLSTVAIRMPRHPVAKMLIEAAGTPLAAPSANRFGRISPTCAEDVARELGDRIDFILDGGPCEVGLESTVISIDAQAQVTLLRPGGISVESIENCLGIPIRRISDSTALLSPGLLPQHYAPAKSLRLLPSPVVSLTSAQMKNLTEKNILPPPRLAPHLGLLVFSGDEQQIGQAFAHLTERTVTTALLSVSGNLEEAAREFFKKLRFLDHSSATLIFAEPCPTENGLGLAISDRLKRASESRKD